MRLVFALFSALVAVAGAFVPAAAQTAPAGEVVVAWHVTIAPSWFDPSTAPPQITPFGILYTLHDALVRPYPGTKMGPSHTTPPTGLASSQGSPLASARAFSRSSPARR